MRRTFTTELSGSVVSAELHGTALAFVRRLHGGKSFMLCVYKTIVLRDCTTKAPCQRKTYALTLSC